MRINWKVGLIFIAIIVILSIIFLYPKNSEKTEANENINTNYTPPTQPSINAPTKDYVADTNYACEDLIPETIILDYRPPRDAKKQAPQGVVYISKLKDNITLDGWQNCYYHEKAGYGIGEFQCGGIYREINRTSAEGVILEDFEISFSLDFDDSSCSETSGGELLNCTIIDYSCSWEYCTNKGC